VGYYVNTVNHNILLRKQDMDKAYKAMCDLNQRDDLKSGGTWGGDGVSAKDPRPEGLHYHPSKWFSWMDANYPDKCKDFNSILVELGFETTYDDDGNLVGVHYDNKIGSEQHFFHAIAPYMADGSYIDWQGEDGAFWRWGFRNGKMTMVDGEITYPNF